MSRSAHPDTTSSTHEDPVQQFDSINSAVDKLIADEITPQALVSEITQEDGNGWMPLAYLILPMGNYQNTNDDDTLFDLLEKIIRTLPAETLEQLLSRPTSCGWTIMHSIAKAHGQSEHIQALMPRLLDKLKHRLRQLLNPEVGPILPPICFLININPAAIDIETEQAKAHAISRLLEQLVNAITSHISKTRDTSEDRTKLFICDQLTGILKGRSDSIAPLQLIAKSPTIWRQLCSHFSAITILDLSVYATKGKHSQQKLSTLIKATHDFITPDIDACNLDQLRDIIAWRQSFKTLISIGHGNIKLMMAIIEKIPADELQASEQQHRRSDNVTTPRRSPKKQHTCINKKTLKHLKKLIPYEYWLLIKETDDISTARVILNTVADKLEALYTQPHQSATDNQAWVRMAKGPSETGIGFESRQTYAARKQPRTSKVGYGAGIGAGAGAGLYTNTEPEPTHPTPKATHKRLTGKLKRNLKRLRNYTFNKYHKLASSDYPWIQESPGADYQRTNSQRCYQQSSLAYKSLLYLVMKDGTNEDFLTLINKLGANSLKHLQTYYMPSRQSSTLFGAIRINHGQLSTPILGLMCSRCLAHFEGHLQVLKKIISTHQRTNTPLGLYQSHNIIATVLATYSKLLRLHGHNKQSYLAFTLAQQLYNSDTQTIDASYLDSVNETINYFAQLAGTVITIRDDDFEDDETLTEGHSSMRA